MDINIYIVDDHPIVLEGIKTILQTVEGFNIIGEALDGATLLKDIGNLKIDIILLDINLPDTNGVDLCKIISEKHKQVKVIALSTFNETAIILDMLNAGASGYLIKNTDKEEMVRAIRNVYEGGLYFSDAVKQLIFEAKLNEVKAPNLTRREKDIINLLSQGMTTHQIAQSLFISNLTVETHRRNILKKFDVNNTTSMLKKASDLRII